MERIGYYNGTVEPLEALRVPFLDRSSLYGDGVYDATMARDGVMLFLDEHLDRFWRSMGMMKLSPNFTKEHLAAELQRVLDLAEARDNFVYWQMTRGTALRKHKFPDAAPNLWIMVTPSSFVDLSQTFDLVSFEDKRFGYCNVKTINLLPNVLAAQHAAEHEADEAVFVRDGHVTECSHSNIYILRDGALRTHPANERILPGIARTHLIEVCEALGIPVVEQAFTLDELKAADEVIVSSSSTFAIRAAHMDGQSVGGKDRETYERIRAALEQEFEDYVARRRQMR